MGWPTPRFPSSPLDAGSHGPFHNSGHDAVIKLRLHPLRAMSTGQNETDGRTSASAFQIPRLDSTQTFYVSCVLGVLLFSRPCPIRLVSVTALIRVSLQ